MSTNKKTSPERTPSQRTKFAFVRYELDIAQQGECKQWKPTFDEMDEMIAGYIEKDYAISMKWDSFNKCYGAFMTTPNKFSPNFNLCLSGRGSTPLRAVKQLVYKDKHCDGVWPAPDFGKGPDTEFDD